MKSCKLIILCIISFIILVSCSPNEPQDTTVDFPTALKTNNIIHNIIADKLLASNDFKQVDLALITYLNTRDVSNISLYEPLVNPTALAIAKFQEKIEYISLNNDTLLESSPLIFPGYFTSNNWTALKHNYNLDANWKLSYSGKNVNVESKYQPSVYKINIDGDDTIRPNKQILVQWNKSPQIGNTENKVYIYFKWYPSYLELNNPKTFIGYDADDTGILAMPYSKLKELEVPLYGIFQISIIRYNIEKINKEGFNILVVNIVESSVSANIKK